MGYRHDDDVGAKVAPDVVAQPPTVAVLAQRNDRGADRADRPRGNIGTENLLDVTAELAPPREGNARVLDLEIVAGIADRLAGENWLVDVQELLRRAVALAMLPERAVAAVLLGVATKTTVMSARPLESRSSVDLMRAACVGDCTPGRTAARNVSPSVKGASAEAISQESGKPRRSGSARPRT